MNKQEMYFYLLRFHIKQTMILYIVQQLIVLFSLFILVGSDEAIFALLFFRYIYTVSAQLINVFHSVYIL